MEIEYVKPADIEKRSFEIIENELHERGIELPSEHASIIKRAIHTTADFDYAENLYFSKDAVSIAEDLLKSGADIITDTNMALSGINKKALSVLGGKANCFMADEDVAKEASERGITRASVSMERASKLSGKTLFAIGNAPTALITLREMIDKNIYRPAFIIAVPVGFVNVEAAKQLIIETDIPCIVARGRKGGSTVAAAICNALLYEVTR